MIITCSHKAFSFICGLVLLASNAVGAEASADLKKSVQSSVEKAVQELNDAALVSKGYQMAKEMCPYSPSSDDVGV